jgi:hypothetical protein
MSGLVRVLLVMLLALSACSNPPMRYIPTADRSLLDAERRLGQDGDPADKSGVSVSQMLDRARNGDTTQVAATGPATRVLLHFDGDAVQPNSSQRAQLVSFASAHRSGPTVLVTSHADAVEAGAQLMDQRRAVAVSRELATSVPDVSIRFDPNIPEGLVVVSSGTAEMIAERPASDTPPEEP